MFIKQYACIHLYMKIGNLVQSPPNLCETCPASHRVVGIGVSPAWLSVKSFSRVRSSMHRFLTLTNQSASKKTRRQNARLRTNQRSSIIITGQELIINKDGDLLKTYIYLPVSICFHTQELMPHKLLNMTIISLNLSTYHFFSGPKVLHIR